MSQLKGKSFLQIKQLRNEPYSKILGYPKSTKRQIDARISEMKQVGITAISFQGKTRLGVLDVLGKGYVGIVVLAKKRKKIVAVKIRRTDSPRKDMNREARLLNLANKAGVGPKVLENTKNLLVMEYLPGEKIGNWVKELKGKGSTAKLKSAIRKVLQDCYNLDKAGFDHGELSSISKHVIIDNSKVTLIDFESSSVIRRVSNVTSATQGIFIGSGISKKVQKIYKISPKEKIIITLRKYKKDSSPENFDQLLRILKL